MLYIATAHFRSPRWIEIQTRYLREQISTPFETWSSLEEIDPSYARHFDRIIEQRGPHAGKLNHLAMEIAEEAADEDLLMFLDGDAFPIADPMPLIEDGLARAPLIAVRRAENLDEPQPHPCFCVTTVGTWRTLPGDWSSGPTWAGPRGLRRSDVGGNLLRRLELTKTPWVDVLRTNRTNLDPVYFAIYGDTIYHHGAGFRGGSPSGTHREAEGPKPFRAPRLPGLARVVQAVNHRRIRSWEQRTQKRRMELSRSIYERIRGGGKDWLDELR
ncbi:MAG: hypothetical protein JWL67_1383 [Solirubrobacterales bacterium]|jgi:hypothetical protein|nr:hypothetical protein [Solirubrobacterales bacterium]